MAQPTAAHRRSPARVITPWSALVAALALVVGVVALVSALLIGSGSASPQDAIAHIPVSTATPYPFPTTSTPWKTQVARPAASPPSTPLSSTSASSASPNLG